jgi:hypothetical protein
MRTTLDLDDQILRRAKAAAAARGESLTRFLEAALRDRLRSLARPAEPFAFRPLVRGGVPVPGVDFEDRDALYERMEGRP